MEKLNIIEHQQLEDQIVKLREVLPTQQERDSARKGVARIDTSCIEAVVQQMKDQAEQPFLELELS